MFRTQFMRERITCCAGERERVIRQLEPDEKGELVLVVVGKESQFDKIQSYRDEADIHVILKKYENGDLSALSYRAGAFGDVSNAPTSYAEAINAVINGKELFYSMPDEARKKFGNNYAAFVAELDDPKAVAEKVGVEIAEALGLFGAAQSLKNAAATELSASAPGENRPAQAVPEASVPQEV